MLDAVLIFDLDGTLFRTESVTVPAVREAFERFGLAPPSRDAICSWIGQPAEEYRPWLVSLCPSDIAERVERLAVQRELELIGEAGELYHGIAEALAELRPTVRHMAICSNGPGKFVHAVLKGCGIAGFFDAVRYRMDDDADKSQMLHDLIAELDVGHLPGVVIGDRQNDVEAAHDNGLLALGAAYGYGDDDELDDADAVLGESANLDIAIRDLLLLGDRR